MPVIMYSRRVRPSFSNVSRNRSTIEGRTGPAGADARPATTRALPPLEPFYYLKNFELVLATIHARYGDLLRDEELRFIAEFPQVPMASRALLTRMVMRRGDLFRVNALRYPEIGDTRAAVKPLVDAGWVCGDPQLDIAQLHGLLTKPELVRCLKLPPRYGSWRKADLKGVMEAQFTERRSFTDWMGAGDGVYRLLVERLCERFRLLFFGEYGRSWTDFVTAELGIFRYEKVDRSMHSRPFRSRSHIELFGRIQECRELLAEGMPLDELTAILPGTIEDSEWLEERRQKLLFLIARERERAGEHAAALREYLKCCHRGARSRAIRLQVKLKDWDAARALCGSALDEPESAAELQAVRRVMPRLHRQMKVPCAIETAPVIPEFEIVLERKPRKEGVEYAVRDLLAQQHADGSTVRYVENGLITGLFGLLCWPAIFAPVPGAFFHDFHHGPVDLESRQFYRRRRAEFDCCLGHLDSGRHMEVIWRVFREKWGIQSPFVRWHQLDKVLLRWALDCFPAAHLRAWFHWILRDTKENRAGFPDLVQFYPAERRYRMIEVKGPGDRLQDNQRRLLEYSVSHGMPVSVCYASLAEGTTRQ